MQVIVPLGPSIPPPYSSSAHLPTHYVHRLISQFNMPPDAPPGEASWPAIIQVLRFFNTECNIIVWPLFGFLTYRGQTYGSAVSLPSNDSGVATFEKIGLFDLPDGKFFQVFVFASTLFLHNITWMQLMTLNLQVVFAFAPGVSGAIWSNTTAIPALGASFLRLTCD